MRIFGVSGKFLRTFNSVGPFNGGFSRAARSAFSKSFLLSYKYYQKIGSKKYGVSICVLLKKKNLNKRLRF